MNQETIDIRILDRAAVICQSDGCDKPARFLFSAGAASPSCSAHCEVHARELAARLRLKLPPAKETRSERQFEASA